MAAEAKQQPGPAVSDRTRAARSADEAKSKRPGAVSRETPARSAADSKSSRSIGTLMACGNPPAQGERESPESCPGLSFFPRLA